MRQSESEEKIIFANKEETFALSGERDEFLDEIAHAFDCKIINRGNTAEFFGDGAAVKKAAAAVRELQYLFRRGAAVTLHEVRMAAKLVDDGEKDTLHEIFGDTILVTAKGKHIRPKTKGQRQYVDAIRKNTVTFGIGPAGTGKTYLAVVMAVAALRKKSVSRIILTRPAVEAGERLGFLPGDLQEKVDPYLRPLFDALQDILGHDMHQKFVGKGIIEIAPLAYMRGRTLGDAFIILDEAQNTTEKQMKMFLTRLGFGSKMAVTGDLSQTDLPRGVTSGLKIAADILKNIKGITAVELQSTDVVRHDIVSRIIDAYDDYERNAGAQK